MAHPLRALMLRLGHGGGGDDDDDDLDDVFESLTERLSHLVRLLEGLVGLVGLLLGLFLLFALTAYCLYRLSCGRRSKDSSGPKKLLWRWINAGAEGKESSYAAGAGNSSSKGWLKLLGHLSS